ncbi:MAG: hypothetical protein O3C21_03865 [Verrucomicrobia bacterium]|nr:hypothetical protein [Verrucomicrobiota bacterium]
MSYTTPASDKPYASADVQVAAAKVPALEIHDLTVAYRKKILFGPAAALTWAEVRLIGGVEAVGSILVIAVLCARRYRISSNLSTRLPVILWLTVLHSLLSAALGFQLANLLNCRHAAALVVVGMTLFVLAWLFSPRQGMVALLLRRMRRPTPSFEH